MRASTRTDQIGEDDMAENEIANVDVTREALDVLAEKEPRFTILPIAGGEDDDDDEDYDDDNQDHGEDDDNLSNQNPDSDD